MPVSTYHAVSVHHESVLTTGRRKDIQHESHSHHCRGNMPAMMATGKSSLYHECTVEGAHRQHADWSALKSRT